MEGKRLLRKLQLWLLYRCSKWLKIWRKMPGCAVVAMETKPVTRRCSYRHSYKTFLKKKHYFTDQDGLLAVWSVAFPPCSWSGQIWSRLCIQMVFRCTIRDCKKQGQSIAWSTPKTKQHRGPWTRKAKRRLHAKQQTLQGSKFRNST